MKIERSRYDELLSGEITLAQVMRAYNELDEWNFYKHCKFLWGEPEATRNQTAMKSIIEDEFPPYEPDFNKMMMLHKNAKTLEDEPTC